ncbi:MAG: M48 family metalloprotease [bacterium]|nr:M48 family metalloprotease [bacterium]
MGSWRLLLYVISWRCFVVMLLAFLFASLARRYTPRLSYLFWFFVLLNLSTPSGYLSYPLPAGELISSFESAWLVETENTVSPPSEAEHVVFNDQTLAMPPTPAPADPSASRFQQPVSFWRTLQRLSPVILACWCLVSIIILLAQCIRFFYFRRRYHRLEEIRAGRAYRLYCDVAQMAGMKPPRLLACEEKRVSPYSISFRGHWRAVVAPRDFLESADDDSLRVVFAHELMHIRHGDSWVNLFRLALFVLFHYHPVRLIADRGFEDEREISRDIEALQLLGMPPRRYAVILIKAFIRFDQFAQSPLAVSTFSLRRPGRVDRVRILAEHRNLAGRGAAFILVLLALFAAMDFVDPVLFARSATPWTIELNDTPHRGRLYKGRTIFDPLAREMGSLARYDERRLWVMEPSHGLSVYDWDGQSVPSRIDSWTFDNRTAPSSRMFGAGFGVRDGIAYVGATPRSLTIPSMIYCLRLESGGRLRFVGSQSTPFITAFAEIGGVLWVGAYDFETGISSLTLYRNNGGANLRTIDSMYFPADPVTAIERLPLAGKIAVAHGSRLSLFLSHDSLEVAGEFDCGGEIGCIRELSGGRLAVIGVEKNREENGEKQKTQRPFICLYEPVLTDYSLESRLRFTREYESRLGMIVDAAAVDNRLLIAGPGFGTALISFEEARPRLVEYRRDALLTMVGMDDSLLFLYPVSSWMRKSDLLTDSSAPEKWVTLH